MKLTILSRYPADRNLVIGEASKVRKTNGEQTLWMPCPKCGTEMILSDHTIMWHDEETVTVEPSLVCEGMNKTYSDQILHDVDNCLAHFYIRKNEIQELSS